MSKTQEGKKRAVFISQDELERRPKPYDPHEVVREFRDGTNKLEQWIYEARVIFPIWGAVEVLYLQKHRASTIKRMVKPYILHRVPKFRGTPGSERDGLPSMGDLQEFLWDSEQPEAQASLDENASETDRNVIALMKEIFQEMLEEHEKV